MTLHLPYGERRKPMTVGELRKALEDYPDDMVVVSGYDNGQSTYLGEVREQSVEHNYGDLETDFTACWLEDLDWGDLPEDFGTTAPYITGIRDLRPRV